VEECRATERLCASSIFGPEAWHVIRDIFVSDECAKSLSYRGVAALERQRRQEHSIPFIVVAVARVADPKLGTSGINFWLERGKSSRCKLVLDVQCEQGRS
jgi:hypothetical protein